MTRTAIYKGVYFAVVAVGAAAALAIVAHYRFSPVVIVVVLAALLVPGRILGFFWRDLLTGLRLLNARNFAESKLASERFLATVRARPWLKRLVWLGTSAYSRDPEVLALNNIGAAEINLGALDLARRHLEQAAALDPLCPLPFYNMAILARVLGSPAEAEQWTQRAAALGYVPGSVSDNIMRGVQARFARTDG